MVRGEIVILAFMTSAEQFDETGACPDEKKDYPQDKRAYQYQENNKARAYFHGALISVYALPRHSATIILCTGEYKPLPQFCSFFQAKYLKI